MIRFELPDEAISQDHRARLLFRVVETLNLSAFTEQAKAVEGEKGRSWTSIRMMLTLWLYAISVGIGSARKIERLTHSDDAFRWIIGDQSVSHSRLSTFRRAHGGALDLLFNDVLAVLLHKGLLSLDLVAQDGTRVRASASAPSFRREASLERCREQAALHLKAVLAEQDDAEATAAEKRARLRAARDYQRRVDEAITTVKQLRESGKDEPRASTTDAEARVMKMGDGGFRPGYNVQMVTAGSPLGGPRTIVGVRVTNVGSDMGSVTPMLDDVKRRTGSLPKVVLADANHAKHECISNAEKRGVRLLVPIPDNAKKADASTAPAVAAWHERMHTPQAERVYRARASLCELPSAHLKQKQGVGQVLVRGLPKVTCVVLLAGIAANVVHHLAGLLS